MMTAVMRTSRADCFCEYYAKCNAVGVDDNRIFGAEMASSY